MFTPKKKNKSLRKKTSNAPPPHPDFARGDGINPDLLPKRLYVTDRYPPEGRINSYSKPDYLLDLVEALEGTKEFKYIRASCFGALFDLPVCKCFLSGKLVHQMLCRSLHTKKKHKIWFVFVDKPFRFSQRDFGILAGLPYGPYPNEETIWKCQTLADPNKPYWDTLFSKEQKVVSIKDIVGWLKRDKRLPGVQMKPDWRRLRLVFIVIVEGILICNSQPVRASKEVVEMVKDLESFEEYIWGNESFLLTLRMVKVSKKISTLDELISKLNQSYTTTHSFTLVFQLLFFKEIPKFKKFIPDSDDEQNFTDQSIIKLTQLKTFHNSNIMETENIANVS